MLFLRRHESPELTKFLADADPQIKREVIRAIYDTAVLDTEAGKEIANLSPQDLPQALQRRIVAANYRLGQYDNARRMLALASDESVAMGVRQYALKGLRMWEANIDTDPVLGHYRPQVTKERSKQELGVELTADLRQFLNAKPSPKLAALATKLANDIGVALDEKTLLRQVADADLDAEVRVATLASLVKLDKAKHDIVIRNLLTDKDPEVQAAAIQHGAARKFEEIEAVALAAVESGPIAAARTGISVIGKAKLGAFWTARETKLRKELWLDAYQQLLVGGDPAVQAWATEAMGNPQSLAQFGGDVAKGEIVFRNQGACMQCHKVGKDGGVQGPDLTILAERLATDKMLESLVNPNAVIAEGYGMSSATLKDGTILIGRLAEQTEAEVLIIGLDGTESRLKRADVTALTPPISAMPPMALTLPLPDLRDLVAFLGSRTKEAAAAEDAASHGESDEEKVAK